MTKEQQSEKKSLKRTEISPTILKKRLEQVAPKVMRYESEFQKIIEQMGETKRTLVISPSRVMTVNLDSITNYSKIGPN